MGFGRMVRAGNHSDWSAIMQRVASQVAVRVSTNALNYESSQAYQNSFLRNVIAFSSFSDQHFLVTSRELPELFRGIVSLSSGVIHHDYTVSRFSIQSPPF